MQASRIPRYSHPTAQKYIENEAMVARSVSKCEYEIVFSHHSAPVVAVVLVVQFSRMVTANSRAKMPANTRLKINMRAVYIFRSGYRSTGSQYLLFSGDSNCSPNHKRKPKADKIANGIATKMPHSSLSLNASQMPPKRNQTMANTIMVPIQPSLMQPSPLLPFGRTTLMCSSLPAITVRTRRAILAR